MRTLSASPIDPVNDADGPTDLDDKGVDGIVSLRQRIRATPAVSAWANGSLIPAGARSRCWATTSPRNWQRR